MSNVLTYKGYYSTVEYDAVDKVLYGKIQFIDDLITFESENSSEIEREFQCAVDDYIETCAEIGKEPQKPFKGSFNVRVSPEIHKQISIAAMHQGVSINQFVSDAIEEKIDGLIHHSDLKKAEERVIDSISMSNECLWTNTTNAFLLTKTFKGVSE